VHLAGAMLDDIGWPALNGKMLIVNHVHSKLYFRNHVHQETVH
jgi:hypothetical protein